MSEQLSPVLLQSQDARGVVTLTLNRPAAYNGLDEELLTALQTAFSTIEKDAAARVVVIRANGKAFSAGHDLKQMQANPRLDYYQQLFAQCSRMMLTLQRMPQPVIAVVQGVATAAGCQLVAMCDLAIASDNARFGVSGINLGLFCATPSVPLSRNIHRKQALHMLLTGDMISAAQAQAQGLINQAVPADQLDATLETVLASICAKPAVAVGMGKRMFYQQLEMGIEAAYQLAGQTMACNMMDSCAQDGVAAFLNKSKH